MPVLAFGVSYQTIWDMNNSQIGTRSICGNNLSHTLRPQVTGGKSLSGGVKSHRKDAYPTSEEGESSFVGCVLSIIPYFVHRLFLGPPENRCHEGQNLEVGRVPPKALAGQLAHLCNILGTHLW